MSPCEPHFLPKISLKLTILKIEKKVSILYFVRSPRLFQGLSPGSPVFSFIPSQNPTS